MADAAQRQRKLAAKAARRKVIVAEKKKFGLPSLNLAGRIGVAAMGRIVRCVLPSNLFELGIGNVVIGRALPTGLLGCAYFLVDVHCLGIKDAFYAEMTQAELQSRLEMASEDQHFIDGPPGHARKLIRDAAAYAADLELSAAKDAPVIEPIFGDADPGACTEVFTFGKDGKPFYVSGPYDTPARIRAITAALEESRGTGGWDYIVELTPEL